MFDVTVVKKKGRILSYSPQHPPVSVNTPPRLAPPKDPPMRVEDRKGVNKHSTGPHRDPPRPTGPHRDPQGPTRRPSGALLTHPNPLQQGFLTFFRQGPQNKLFEARKPYPRAPPGPTGPTGPHRTEPHRASDITLCTNRKVYITKYCWPGGARSCGAPVDPVGPRWGSVGSGGVRWSLGTARSNKDYCSPVLCLESEAKNPFPLFSRLLRLAREGLGCMHILCSRAYPGNVYWWFIGGMFIDTGTGIV